MRPLSDSSWFEQDKVMAEVRTLGARAHIPDINLLMSTWREEHLREMVMQLLVRCLAVEEETKMVKGATYYLPRTWWEWWKLEVGVRLTRNAVTPLGKRLDRWMNEIERRPVVSPSVPVVVSYRLCPHIPIPPGQSRVEFEQEPHLDFMATGSSFVDVVFDGPPGPISGPVAIEAEVLPEAQMVRCPHCRKAAFEVLAGSAGIRTKCSRCGARFEVSW